MSGALHDKAHAITIGDTTYGKGIAQCVMPSVAAGAAVETTCARYKTPSGKWPGDADKEKHGLKPDIELRNPKGSLVCSAQDMQLRAALRKAKELEYARK